MLNLSILFVKVQVLEVVEDYNQLLHPDVVEEVEVQVPVQE